MNNEHFPFVSVVFPNRNGKEDTLECLNSLRKLEYPKNRLEIIISDNGSTDGSQNLIQELFSQMRREGWLSLKLIENKKNLGPSLARNKGIEAVNKRYNYIWMIDNDIVVDKDALNILFRFIQKDNEIGIIGSVNYFFDNPNRISFCGGILNAKTGRIKYFNQKKLRESNLLNTDYVTGSSLLIRKEVIEEIGVFDPDYFCYYNDTDICFRAKKAGFKICIASQSNVWHKVSSSTKKITGFEIYYKTRNRIIFMKKNIKSRDYFLFLAFQLLFEILWSTFLLIYTKQISEFIYLYKGYKDGFFFNK